MFIGVLLREHNQMNVYDIVSDSYFFVLNDKMNISSFYVVSLKKVKLEFCFVDPCTLFSPKLLRPMTLNCFKQQRGPNKY